MRGNTSKRCFSTWTNWCW